MKELIHKFKMAAVLAMICAAIASYSFAQQQKPSVSSPIVGKYQLFQGKHIGYVGSTEESTILRLNTQTGHVDEWVQGTHYGSNTSYSNWMPINEL